MVHGLDPVSGIQNALTTKAHVPLEVTELFSHAYRSSFSKSRSAEGWRLRNEPR
jgi:hypothetical protein